MVQKFSLHTHTTGYDGKNTVAEMINQGQALGWHTIGISNHMEFHENLPLFHPMFFADYKAASDLYKKTIDEIREQATKTKMRVLVGFEVDFFPSRKWRTDFENLIKDLDYDYLIGSTHCIYNKDESKIYHLYDYTRPKVPDKEFTDSYWNNIKEAIKSGYFDTIAHLDLWKIFGLDGPMYREDKSEVAELLAKYNVATEFNTGCKTKYDAYFPSDDMLRELNDNNVALMVSDDSHAVETLGQHFDEAEEILAKIGYKNRFTPEDLKK